MTDTNLRTHPLIVIAATTVILTCLVAIGVMTGIVPSPLARERASAQVNPTAPAPDLRSALVGRSTSADAAAAPADPVSPSFHAARQGGSAVNVTPGEQRAATERAPVGATASTPPSNTVAGGRRAPRVAAVCTTCGTVTSVRAVTQQGQAGLLGPVGGGAVGGLVGHQIGHGSGRTIATIVGAAGGAALGTELERRHNSSTHYVVTVRLNDGTHRTFNYGSDPGLHEGERVRVVDGRLVRGA